MNCIHLDFHTSPDIDGIGEHFDKAELTRTVRESGIDLMTVFAKCHHGYTYYPTKVGRMHPGLKFNLLGEEIEAIHAAGARAPIYIPIGWSKLDADLHPEWHQLDPHTGMPVLSAPIPDDPNAPLDECAWVALCPVGGYLDYLKELTHELCQSFDTSDGVFYDICFVGRACACESCRRGAREMGLDPDKYEDAQSYYTQKHIELMKTLTGIVHGYTPSAPVFFNGGADMNRTEYHPYQTHFELEDLPTAWGGYDLMPLRAKFFEKYGKPFLGMTGKFHHAWGEFGGFKNKEALRYECADMLSVGASISVGDHLHPSGKLDESTYAMIAHAFGYVKRIEKICLDTLPHSDIGIVLSHCYESDMGASKLLQAIHLEYRIAEPTDDLSGYKCLILPDAVRLDADGERAIAEFVENGGKVIASYESAFDALGVRRIAPSEYDADYIGCELEDCKTPFFAYSSAYRVDCDGEVLAKVFEPYFSRTAGHFSGHKNTPNRLTAADYPALVSKGGVLYFAHPIFRAYNNSGSYLLERYIERGIDLVYDREITVENLPSSGRVRLREGRDGSLVLHLLYSPPVNRGNVCLLCDFPTLHDVCIGIKTDKKVTRVRTEPDGEELDFTQSGDRLSFVLPPFSLHKLVVID